MTRIICLASGKGGVGKTVTTVNLAAGLAQLKQSVIVVDGNLTTSNIGLHLGIPLYPVTLQDVLRGKAKITDAIYFHSAGFRVIPGDISLEKSMTPKSRQLIRTLYRLTGDADFMLIDSAAGLSQETQATIKAADELITVTNPEMPALTDALKLAKMTNRFQIHNLGVIINRVRGERNEFSSKDAKEFLNLPLIGEVHEDKNVRLSIAAKEPVVLHRPRSKAARQFKEIAARLLGPKAEEVKPVSLIHRLFGWL